MSDGQVYAVFFGDETFPVHWENDEEKREFWWYDDLHCPKPISPLYFDIGGWWGSTCAYMFRRFGVPFGKEWVAKKINGYVYTAVKRRSPDEAARLAPYFEMVLPVYAERFLEWWRERYLPEIQRNLKYLDEFPYATSSLVDLMILLEDALDIQERHFRIHWILNLAQFAAFQRFQEVAIRTAGGEAKELVGKVLVSVDDRNWDSARELWQIKEAIKQQENVAAVFRESVPASEVLRKLEEFPEGQQVLRRIQEYTKEFGFKAIYAHEYRYPLWIEDPTPVIEMLRDYLRTDYDFNQDIDRVRREQRWAIEELRSRLQNEADRNEFDGALRLALAVAPLTPDHHFYIDQGTYARMRIVLREIGKKLVERGDLASPEDIFFLLYEEIRQIAAKPDAFAAREVVAKRRKEVEAAAAIVPRDWVGTADHWSLYEQGYIGLWGYPERFQMAQAKADEPRGEIRGLGASPGLVEGVARVVGGPEELDKVQKGEILVCQMTNPAWTLVFTKISGLVTDAGGVLSHPAVVAREFGIPAVTGTVDATRKIQTGQRLRVDGTQGVVYILNE